MTRGPACAIGPQARPCSCALRSIGWHGARASRTGRNFPNCNASRATIDLTPPEQSWRQARGYAGRRPGDPPWNASRYAVFRELAREVDAPTAGALDDQMTQLAKLMSQLNPDRDAVVAAGGSARALADKLVTRIQQQPYDAAMTLRLLHAHFRRRR